MPNQFEAETKRSASLLGLIFHKMPIAQRGKIKLRNSPYDGFFIDRGRHVAVELKSLKKKGSFPLANIASHQIEGLREALQAGCDAYLVISMRGRPIRAWFIHFADWDLLLRALGDRKSIPLSWFLDGSPFLHEIPRVHILDERGKKSLVWDWRRLLEYRHTI